MATRRPKETPQEEAAQLLVSRSVAREQIKAQIEKGNKVFHQPVNTDAAVELFSETYGKWNDFNRELLRVLLSGERLLKEYDRHRYISIRMGGGIREKLRYNTELMRGAITELESLDQRLDLIPQAEAIGSQAPKTDAPTRIFIGHGRSAIWKDLKDFIVDRLRLEYEEFNREPPAGKSNKERLQEMLVTCGFALVVMTGEDEVQNGKLRARENVVHEAGLFQGKLGFEKAIILLEEGCEQFSNIEGLIQLRFPPGKIMAVSEDIRRTLEREGLISR